MRRSSPFRLQQRLPLFALAVFVAAGGKYSLGSKAEPLLAFSKARFSRKYTLISEDGTLMALDVRFTLKTDDGAFIYVEYCGRGNLAEGTIVVAPTFQTGHEKYKWLNRVQAIAAGQLNLETGKLIDRLNEVTITPEVGLV